MTTARIRAFGSAIDMSYSETDDRYGLLVGAPDSIVDASDSDAGIVLGAAFYYERSAQGNWELSGSLSPTSTPLAVDGGYGAAVALAAGPRVLVVGCPKHQVSGNSVDRGKVFVYQPNPSGAFQEIGSPLNGAFSDSLFGSAVDVSKAGDIVVVGAPGTPGAATGAVYIYSDVPNRWRESFAMIGPVSSNFGPT